MDILNNIELNIFPTEYEEEVLSLLETYGDFADLPGVADYLGVTPRALYNFTRTKRARAAAALAPSNAKEITRKHAHTRLLPEPDPHLNVEPSLEGTNGDILEIFPVDEGLVLPLMTNKPKDLHDVRPTRNS